MMRLPIWFLVVFTVGVIVGAWATDARVAATNRCAFCGEPLHSWQVVTAHADCWRAHVEDLAQRMARMQGANIALNPGSPGTTIPNTPTPIPNGHRDQ